MQGVRLNEDDTRQSQKGQKFSRETRLLLVVLGRPRGLYCWSCSFTVLLQHGLSIPHNGLVHGIKLSKMIQLFIFSESVIVKFASMYKLRVLRVFLIVQPIQKLQIRDFHECF